MSRPWMKFYPSDWRSDPALRSCGLSARGLWAEMLCIMHEATPRGSLVINEKAISMKLLASLSGSSLKETEAGVAELEEHGVFSRDPDGTIYSRRMRRDEDKAARDKANGSTGGNPQLKPRDNPPVNPQLKPGVGKGDKAHIPDATRKNPSSRLGISAAGDSSSTPRGAAPDGYTQHPDWGLVDDETGEVVS